MLNIFLFPLLFSFIWYRAESLPSFSSSSHHHGDDNPYGYEGYYPEYHSLPADHHSHGYHHEEYFDEPYYSKHGHDHHHNNYPYPPPYPQPYPQPYSQPYPQPYPQSYPQPYPQPYRQSYSQPYPYSSYDHGNPMYPSEYFRQQQYMPQQMNNGNELEAIPSMLQQLASPVLRQIQASNARLGQMPTQMVGQFIPPMLH